MTDKEAILARHAVRNYTDRKIEKDKVDLIKEKILAFYVISGECDEQ